MKLTLAELKRIVDAEIERGTHPKTPVVVERLVDFGYRNPEPVEYQIDLVSMDHSGGSSLKIRLA